MKKRLGEIPQNLRPEIPARTGEHFGKIPQQKRPDNSARNTARRGKFSSQAINVSDNAATPLNINKNRVYLLIQNNGANDVFLNFANKATTLNIKIIAGGNYEPLVAPIDSISLVCAAGLTSLCSVVEAVGVGDY